MTCRKLAELFRLDYQYVLLWWNSTSEFVKNAIRESQLERYGEFRSNGDIAQLFSMAKDSEPEEKREFLDACKELLTLFGKR